MARGRKKDAINRQWRIDQAVLAGEPLWAPRRSSKSGLLVPVLPSWLLPGWPEHLEIPEHPPLAPPIPNGRPPKAPVAVTPQPPTEPVTVTATNYA